MTPEQVIAAQATRILELEAWQRDAIERFRRIQVRMVCVGGPLNDNRLGYTREQQADFHYIMEEARYDA